MWDLDTDEKAYELGLYKLQEYAKSQPSKMANAYLKYFQSRRYYDKGKYEEVIKDLQPFLEGYIPTEDCLITEIRYLYACSEYQLDTSCLIVPSLGEYKEILNSDVRCLIDFHFKLGKFYIQNQKEQQGIANLIRSYDVAKTNTLLEDTRKSLIELSRHYLNNGDRLRRINLCEEAVNYYRGIGDSVYITKGLLELASAYKHALIYDKSIEIYYSLLPYYENMEDFLSMGYIYNNISMIEGQLNRNNEAIKGFEKAIFYMSRVAEPIPNGNRARPYLNLAYQYEFIKEYSKAYSYFNKAYDIAVQDGAIRLSQLIRIQIADMQTRLNLLDEAGAIFVELIHSDFIFNVNKAEVINLYLRYADFLLKYGHPEKSKEYCEKALSITSEFDVSLKLREECAGCLRNYYEQVGDYKNAYVQLDSIKSIVAQRFKSEYVESLNTERLKDQLRESERAHEEFRIRIADERVMERDRYRKKATILILIVLILVLSVTMLFWVDIKNKEINEITIEKNRELSALNEELILLNNNLNSSVNKIEDQKKKIEDDLRNKILYLLDNKKIFKEIEALVASSSIEFSEKNKIFYLLKKSLNGNEWNEMEQQFLDIHDDFVLRLSKLHPDLTANNIKLCILIRLGLSSKEIAYLRHVTEGSLKVAKNRLRKQLNIDDQGVKLFAYLSSL